jgi:hypothetical protein
MESREMPAAGKLPLPYFAAFGTWDEPVRVPKRAVRPGRAAAAYRLMETLLGTLRSAHGSEYRPADFYAGLRPCPLVNKGGFPSTRWFK